MVLPKRKQLAYSRKGKPEPEPELADVKSTLMEIRTDALKHFFKYETNFKRSLRDRNDVVVHSARTGLDAFDLISGILGDIDTLATNNSSTVREIIAQLPEDHVLNFFDSYTEAVRWGVEAGIKNTPDMDRPRYGYWDLPSHDPVQIWNSFSIEPLAKGYYRSEAPYIPGDYASLMGVNCVSSTGDIFLLQHLQNMSNILAGSKKAIFIIGIEKLAGSYEQALFQTRCSALYGYETILLDLFSRPDYQISLSDLEKIPKSRRRKKKETYFEFKMPSEVHVILLDNGRKDLLKTEFRDILKCIGCKACSKLCPRTRWNAGTGMNARDMIMMSFIMGLEHARDTGLFNCTLCRNCQDVCPVEIPLQEFILKLRKACEREGLMPEVYERISRNVADHNNPYGT